MMAHFYVAPQRNQDFLLAVNMADWLEKGHLAFFVIDVVARLDTTALHARHPNDGAGRPAYDPDMMLALVLYAYANGVRSSRRIEATCRTDAAYRVISGALVPDHSTIARFVVDHQGAMEGLFVSGLRLCHAAGLVDLSVLALDGTKLGSDSALDRNRDAEWIRARVGELMAETVASETTVATDTPLFDVAGAGGLATAKGRRAVLEAALAVIEADDAQAAAAVAAKTALQAKEAEAGRKVPGRKPQDPAAALERARVDRAAALQASEQRAARRAQRVAAAEEAGHKLGGRPPGPDLALAAADAALAAAEAAAGSAPPPPRRPVNITDPESRIMKTKDGWVQGFNAQALVTKDQIVVAASVTQDANDVGQFIPMLARLSATLAAARVDDPVELILADAGYWSDANATAEGPERLIATIKDWKQRTAAREAGTTTGEPPEDASPLESMEHRLRTAQGAAAYAQRSFMVEPVFGDHKHNRGQRRFRRRGLAAANAEWHLMNLTGNMRKLFEHTKAPAATPA